MYTNQYLMSLIHESNQLLRWQAEKIIQLEKELVSIKEQLQMLHSSPRTNIERIEYNFEQLKVESLEGTLTIGISHGLSGSIEDLWVNNQHSEDVTLGSDSDKDMMNRIREDVYQYIRDNIPSVVDKQSEAKQIELSPDEKKSIIEDIIRQTDERISLYLKQMKGKYADEDNALPQMVSQKLKSDIDMAVDQYIEHFRKDEEG